MKVFRRDMPAPHPDRGKRILFCLKRSCRAKCFKKKESCSRSRAVSKKSAGVTNACAIDENENSARLKFNEMNTTTKMPKCKNDSR